MPRFGPVGQVLFAAISAVGLVAGIIGPVHGSVDAQAAAELTGEIPPGGGLALVVWGGGTVEQLRATSATRGCVLRSAWSVEGGSFVGHLVGAPAPVNQAFATRFPALALPAGRPLVLVCEAGSSASTAAALPASAPTTIPFAATTYRSEIRANAFEQTIEVPAGATIVWTNLDGVAHTVTSDDLRIDSPFLTANQSFEVTFDRPTRFGYFCRLHQHMTGEVIVR